MLHSSVSLIECGPVNTDFLVNLQKVELGDLSLQQVDTRTLRLYEKYLQHCGAVFQNAAQDTEDIVKVTCMFTVMTSLVYSICIINGSEKTVLLRKVKKHIFCALCQNETSLLLQGKMRKRKEKTANKLGNFTDSFTPPWSIYFWLLPKNKKVVVSLSAAGVN